MNKRNIVSTAFLVSLLTVVLFVGVWQIKPAQATYIFEDDFELGNGFGGWTGTSGSPVIVTSPVRSGVNATKITDGTKYAYKTISATPTIHWRGYVNFSSLLAVDTDYVAFSAIGISQAAAGIVRNGGVTYWALKDSHASWHNATTSPSAGVWHCVELLYAGTAGANDDKLFIDGNLTPVATGEGRVADQTDVRCGSVQRSGTIPDFYIDSWVADADYIGPIEAFTADYTITGNGVNYYAYKSTNLTPIIWGSNLATVINYVYALMSNFQSVEFRGTFTITSTCSTITKDIIMNFTLATVTVTGTFFQINSGVVQIVGGYFVGVGSGAQISIVNSNGCKFVGVDFENFETISAYGSSYTNFTSCVWHDETNMYCAIITSDGAGHHNFMNCTFNNTISAAVFISDGQPYNEFSNCTWDNVGNHGIYFDGGSGSVGSNIVVGCSFFNHQYGAGLHIKCNDNKIYDNDFYNFAGGVGLSIYSEYTGSTANDNEIYNNTFTDMGEALWVGHDPANYPTLRNKIHNNTFTTVTNCIRLNPWSGAINTTEDTWIYNNTFSSCTTVFPASGSSASLIKNTVVRDNNFNGISVGSWISTCTNTTIYNNTDMTGYYMLNMSVVGNGYTVPDGLGWQYYAGTSASVAWTPTGGNSRQDFSIDGANQTTTTSPISITMSADHVGIAYFSGTPPPVVLVITYPQNITYPSPTIPVQLSASGGTIDEIWWNCTYSDGTPIYANTTYTVPTTMTLGVGNYIFYAMANNTDGEWTVETVSFTVEIGFASEWGGYWGRWWGYP